MNKFKEIIKEAIKNQIAKYKLLAGIYFEWPLLYPTDHYLIHLVKFLLSLKIVRVLYDNKPTEELEGSYYISIWFKDEITNVYYHLKCWNKNKYYSWSSIGELTIFPDLDNNSDTYTFYTLYEWDKKMLNRSTMFNLLNSVRKYELTK